MSYHLFFALLVAVHFFSCTTPDPAADIKTSDLSEVKETKKQSVVFIAGFDGTEDGNNYYHKATAHFKAKKMTVVEGVYSLKEVVHWLIQNEDQTPYDEIHIVSHSNAWRGLSLAMVPSGDRITKKGLTQLLEQKTLPTLDHRITEETKVIFHACGLGKNEALLRLLKSVFTSEVSPQVYASPHFNVFGGKFAAHYLAKAYYVYYPTAQSKGPLALSKAIESTYPDRNMDWLTALKSRTETKLGVPYSYRFNIPVNWEVSFEHKDDIPAFPDTNAIMDWVTGQEEMATALFELNIPMDQYRWSTSQKGRVLSIKGKTTVVCILQAITNELDPNEYATPSLANPLLYTCL